MPISVRCACSARFKVRDELAGRRGKCPQCGRVLTIGPAAAPVEQMYDVAGEPPPAPPAPPAPSAPALMQSASEPEPALGLPPGYRPRSKQAQVRFAISPKMMLLIGAFILVPSVIWVVRSGPVRARDQWQVMEPQAESDIRDVICKALSDREEAAMKSFIAKFGPMRESEDPGAARAKYTPTINTLLLDSPTIMWNVPEKVSFQGRINRFIVASISAAGKPELMDIHGVYYTRTRQVEADVGVDGQPMKVRGRIVDGAVVME